MAVAIWVPAWYTYMTRDTTDPYLRREAFTYMTRDMTHPYLRREASHMSTSVLLSVGWHDSCIFATWHIHIYDAIRPHVWPYEYLVDTHLANRTKKRVQNLKSEERVSTVWVFTPAPLVSPWVPLSSSRVLAVFVTFSICMPESFDICVSISAILALAVSSSIVLAVYVTLSIRMTELFVWVPRRCRLGGDYLGGTCCLCDVVRVYCQVICVSTSLKCVTWLIHWFDMRHVTCLGGMSHMWMSHDMYMNTCMSDDMHMRSHALEACHMPRRYSASSFSSKIDVCVYIDTKSLHTYKHTTKRMTGSFVRVSHRYYRVAKTHRLP